MQGSDTMLISFGTPILLGVILHQVFRRTEPEMIVLSNAVPVLLSPLICSLLRKLISGRYQILATDAVVCFASWIGSVAFYRLSPFHPLSGIPGPKSLHISKISNAWIYSGGEQHKLFLKLHRKYGPIVRVGPSEVSIAEASAVKSVLGADGLPKGNYYNARRDPSSPVTSLIALRGDQHTQRRRLWDHGMGSEPLKDYTDILSRRGLQLVHELEMEKGVVDMSAWISYFSYDFMGDMAFGGGFEMMRDHGDKQGSWKMIEDFLQIAVVVSHIPWFLILSSHVPGLSGPLERLRRFAIRTATSRLKGGAKTKDLWYYLTDEASLETKKPSLVEVISEGGLTIIAGADTVATAITSVLYLLLSHPKEMARVREEIDQVYPPGSNPTDTRMHPQLVFLDACLKEAMRLYPPVPTNGSRRVVKGSGGKTISGRMIPEETEVFVPPYCLHRNGNYFSDPDEFIPDRWLGEGSATVVPDAYIPFSRGPANCAGRNLARIEMLMIASLLLHTFDFQIANKNDFKREVWENGLKDIFVFTRGKLRVSLTKRT